MWIQGDLNYEIINLISLKREGEYWDFKEKHHDNKADLLHDIICMANNRADKDGYLIYGVSDHYEIKGVANDENRRNQQGIIDFLKYQILILKIILEWCKTYPLLFEIFHIAIWVNLILGMTLLYCK